MNSGTVSSLCALCKHDPSVGSDDAGGESIMWKESTWKGPNLGFQGMHNLCSAKKCHIERSVSWIATMNCLGCWSGTDDLKVLRRRRIVTSTVKRVPVTTARRLRGHHRLQIQTRDRVKDQRKRQRRSARQRRWKRSCWRKGKENVASSQNNVCCVCGWTQIDVVKKTL